MEVDPLIDVAKYFDVRNRTRFEFVELKQPIVEQIWIAIQRVGEAIRIEGGSEEDENEILRRLYRLRSLITESPYPYSSNETGIASATFHLASILQGKSPTSEISVATNSVMELLSTLESKEQNPVAPSLKKALREDSIIVIKDIRRVSEVTDFIKNEFGSNCLVVVPKDLVNIEPCRHAIYLGSPMRLSTVFGARPDTRFLLDPRCEVNTFIMYPFSKMPKLEGLLPLTSIVPSIKIGVKFEVTSLDTEGESFTDWDIASSRLRHTSSGEVVEKARLVGLAGHHYIWAEALSRSQCRVLTIDPTGALDIQSIPLSELGENQFIVERTASSSGSMIDQLADSLGAKKLRKAQTHFKELLMARAEKFGNFARFESELRNRSGIQTSNLRRWMYDPRSIAPQSEADFLKIMDFLGQGEVASKMWLDLKQIRTFHLKAGMEILQRLRKALTETDILPTLQSQGFTLVSVKDCGAIGAFKVEHVDSEIVEVPVSTIDVILKEE